MPELDTEETSERGAITNAAPAPSSAMSPDAIAKMRAIEQARLELASRPRPPRKRVGPNVWAPLALVVALLLVAGVGYGAVQWNAARQRQAAEVLATQAAAQKKSQEQLAAKKAAALAAKTQASQKASQQATIAEGKLTATRIDALKALRTELTGIMNDLKSAAKSSGSASQRWDSASASRRASYASRRGSAAAHNAAERRRYLASKTEVSSNGKLVIRYTYHPRYVGLPGAPGAPGPLNYSVASERKRLSKLQNEIGDLRSTIASDVPALQHFSGTYQVLDSTAKSLAATVHSAGTMAGGLVVSRGAKGHVIDASRIAKVKLSALDGPFGTLDTTFASALTSAGLTPAQVTAQ